MVFVESPWFSRFVAEAMDDETCQELQVALVENPAAGVVIPGAAGLRKLRWRLPGQGKRGGARVIYYWWVRADRVYLLYGYGKSEREDLTREQLRRLADVMRQEVGDE